RQRLAKSLQPIDGGLGVLRDLGEGGALLSRGLHGHGAVKVLEIVLFADSIGTAGTDAGGHAVSAATAVLGEHSAGTGEQSDSDNQHSYTGNRDTKCRHTTDRYIRVGNTVGRYGRWGSSSVEHRPSFQEHCTVGSGPQD